MTDKCQKCGEDWNAEVKPYIVNGRKLTLHEECADNLRRDCEVTEEHEHEWGEVEHSRFAGNPHRKCQVEGCREITLDLSDEEEEEEVPSLYPYRDAIDGMPVDSASMDLGIDNDGQLIIYTNLYEWADGAIRTIPEDEDANSN